MLQPLHGGQQYKTIKHHSAMSNTTDAAATSKDGKTPWLVLHSLNDTFDTKSIQLPFHPNVVKIGRQTNKSTVPGSDNGYFDNKVMSRTHAEVWANENGRACIKDVKSSNGTFVNGIRLSKENEESGVRELLPGDTLELGIDILNDETGSILHRKVSARIDHAGYSIEGAPSMQKTLEKAANAAAAAVVANGQSNSSRLLNGSVTGGKVDVNGAVSTGSAGSSATGIGMSRRGVSVDAVIRLISNTTKKSMQTAEELKQAISTLDASMSGSQSTVQNDKDDSQNNQNNPFKNHVMLTPEKHASGAAKDRSDDLVSSHGTDESLRGQLEAAQIAREQGEARIEELESKLMLEREARIVIEEQLKAMPERRWSPPPFEHGSHQPPPVVDVPVPSASDYDDDETNSIASLDTLVAIDQAVESSEQDGIERGEEDGNVTIPHGTDEVGDDNGAGTIERLENLLRQSRADLESWKVRAESAESQLSVSSMQLVELRESLAATTTATAATTAPVDMAGNTTSSDIQSRSKRESTGNTSKSSSSGEATGHNAKSLNKGESSTFQSPASTSTSASAAGSASPAGSANSAAAAAAVVSKQQSTGRGAAMVGVFAVLMFGVGIMGFIERYVPKKDM